jgi:hypothetical protein
MPGDVRREEVSGALRVMPDEDLFHVLAGNRNPLFRR